MSWHVWSLLLNFKISYRNQRDVWMGGWSYLLAKFPCKDLLHYWLTKCTNKNHSINGFVSHNHPYIRSSCMWYLVDNMCRSKLHSNFFCSWDWKKERRWTNLIFDCFGFATLKLGSQYATQLRDVAKRVVPRRVCRKFRLRVYPSDTATCTVSALPRR